MQDNTNWNIQQGLIPISDCVNEAIADVGGMSQHLFAEFLRCAYRALMDINLTVHANYKTVALDLDELGRIPFPADMVDWNKLGMWDRERDRIINLDINNRLPLIRIQPSEISQVQQFPEPTLSYVNYYGTSKAISNIYGYGNLWNGKGYFRLDEENRYFCFSSEVIRASKKIIIEYTSMQYEIDGQNMVSFLLKEVIIQGIHYFHTRKKKNVPRGDKEANKMDYEEAKRKAIASTDKLTREDILHSIRKHSKSVPKL